MNNSELHREENAKIKEFQSAVVKLLWEMKDYATLIETFEKETGYVNKYYRRSMVLFSMPSCIFLVFRTLSYFVYPGLREKALSVFELCGENGEILHLHIESRKNR
jgi:hypothetical protein